MTALSVSMGGNGEGKSDHSRLIGQKVLWYAMAGLGRQAWHAPREDTFTLR